MLYLPSSFSHYHISVQFDGLLTVCWTHSGLYTETFLHSPPHVYMGNNTLLTRCWLALSLIYGQQFSPNNSTVSLRDVLNFTDWLCVSSSQQITAFCPSVAFLWPSNAFHSLMFTKGVTMQKHCNSRNCLCIYLVARAGRVMFIEVNGWCFLWGSVRKVSTTSVFSVTKGPSEVLVLKSHTAWCHIWIW